MSSRAGEGRGVCFIHSRFNVVLKISMSLQLRTEWDIGREKDVGIDGRGGRDFLTFIMRSLFLSGEERERERGRYS